MVKRNCYAHGKEVDHRLRVGAVKARHPLRHHATTADVHSPVHTESIKLQLVLLVEGKYFPLELVDKRFPRGEMIRTRSLQVSNRWFAVHCLRCRVRIHRDALSV